MKFQKLKLKKKLLQALTSPIKFFTFLYANLYLQCFALGALLTQIFAPFNFLPLVVVSFCGLLFIIRNHSNTRLKSFYHGWWFGFGHYTTSLYWFSNPLLLYPEQFGWMVPFAITLIPAILGIYVGLATLGTYHFKSNKAVFVTSFISMWVIVEVLRSYFVIPFPWNLLAYSLTSSDSLMQITSVIGLFGGSILVCLIGTFLYTMNKKFILVSLVIITSAWLFGVNRINDYSDQVHEDFKIRIVQPNIQDQAMGDHRKQDLAFINLTALSTENLEENIKLIIWPEASYPYGYVQGRTNLHGLSQIAPPNNGAIIFGTDRIVSNDDSSYKFLNSMMAITDKNKISGVYDKEILVPFGEYIPFKRFIPFVEKITYGAQDFSKGLNTSRTIRIYDYPIFQPLICYEIIFPQIKISDDAKWIINFTNDAWFGNTIGPYQLLAMAQLRAVEFGLPVVRAANSGVSALISPIGRIEESLPLSSRGILNISLPKNIPIIFSWIKDIIVAIPFFTMLLFLCPRCKYNNNQSYM